MGVEFIYDVFTYTEIEPYVIHLEFVYDDTVQYIIEFGTFTECQQFLQELHEFALSIEGDDIEDQELLIEEFLLSKALYFTNVVHRINPTEW